MLRLFYFFGITREETTEITLISNINIPTQRFEDSYKNLHAMCAVIDACTNFGALRRHKDSTLEKSQINVTSVTMNLYIQIFNDTLQNGKMY